MSNFWVNIRFAYWHLQIGPDRPCVRLLRNDYHVGKLGRSSPWFEVY